MMMAPLRTVGPMTRYPQHAKVDGALQARRFNVDASATSTSTALTPGCSSTRGRAGPQTRHSCFTVPFGVASAAPEPPAWATTPAVGA